MSPGFVVHGGGSADVGALLRAASVRLQDCGVDSARVDAELLLAFAAGITRGELTRAAVLGHSLARLCPGRAADDVAAAYASFVDRRCAREPLQHITGRAPFRNLELSVGPGVFIPRPETEAVTQVALDAAASRIAEVGSAVVVDLCTGSGAIALAIATELPGAIVYAVELDARAHEWARRNIDEITTATRWADGGRPQVTLVKGDARRALPQLAGRCDVAVSNPPYVPPGATPKDVEVAQHDPAVALYGLGADGLEVPRGIVDSAARLLRAGGTFVMEHAEVQATAAARLVHGTGMFVSAHTRNDLTGRPRMVVATRTTSTNALDTWHPQHVGDFTP